MERLTKADRISTAAAAVAHDLNNDLTVIFSAVDRVLQDLEPGDPARDLLLDIRGAAQRCAWKARGLLNYSVREGGKAVAAEFEALIDS